MKFTGQTHPSITEIKFRYSPVMIRVNKFDESSAKEFSESMSMAHCCDQPIIPVIIDSYGGQVDSLFCMVSDIKNASKPVATVVIGKAMSCGSVLASCGTSGYRFADPDSRLMIHEIANASVHKKYSDYEASTEEMRRLNQHVYEMMAKNAGGKPPDYFIKQMHERNNADWYLTPEEARQHGLIDHIRVPSMVRKVEVSYIFE